jgi:hypothetical protein
MIDNEEVIIAGDNSQLIFEIAYVLNKFLLEVDSKMENEDYKSMQKKIKAVQKELKKIEKEDPEYTRELLGNAREFVEEIIAKDKK